jgi:hypothetical protein
LRIGFAGLERADPLADITVLQRPSEISTIIKNGQVVDREAGGLRQPA